MGRIYNHLTDNKTYLQRAEKSQRETTVNLCVFLNSCFFNLPLFAHKYKGK